MVSCYAQPAKEKSRLLCQAFAESCGGTVVADCKLRDGPVFLYGVSEWTEGVWNGIADRDFYYADNSYFDGSREEYYRITKNAPQHSGQGTSDGKRLAALGVSMAPWRTSGRHIVVCPQSDHFMRAVARYKGDWTTDVLRSLKALTDRPIRVRAWSRNKGKLAASLPEDLVGAHALVTWSSAAAVTALLAGVPVVCTGPSACAPMAGAIEQIESLPKRDREQWAGVLADQQWTLPEIRRGDAWRALNGC